MSLSIFSVLSHRFSFWSRQERKWSTLTDDVKDLSHELEWIRCEKSISYIRVWSFFSFVSEASHDLLIFLHSRSFFCALFNANRAHTHCCSLTLCLCERMWKRLGSLAHDDVDDNAGKMAKEQPHITAMYHASNFSSLLIHRAFFSIIQRRRTNGAADASHFASRDKNNKKEREKPRKFHSSPAHYLWMVFCSSHKRGILSQIQLNYCQCRMLRAHKPLTELHNLITFISHRTPACVHYDAVDDLILLKSLTRERTFITQHILTLEASAYNHIWEYKTRSIPVTCES